MLFKTARADADSACLDRTGTQQHEAGHRTCHAKLGASGEPVQVHPNGLFAKVPELLALDVGLALHRPPIERLSVQQQRPFEAGGGG